MGIGDYSYEALHEGYTEFEDIKKEQGKGTDT